MPTYTGTTGSDTLTGTDSDDIFYSSLGGDIIVGGGGYDTAIIDYSAITGSTSVGQSVQLDSFYGGLNAVFRAPDGITSVEIHQVENIQLTPARRTTLSICR